MTVAPRRALKRTGLALGLLLSVASMIFAFASPANAATVKSYYNGYLGGSHYLNGPKTSEGPAKVGGYDSWTIQSLSNSASGHERVFLKATNGTTCLDSHAAKNGGAAWTVKCNGGDYQIWEVFPQSNGSRVFKGWGSYTKQGLHLCLSSSGTTGAIMSTCNTSNSRQQWYGATAAGN